MSDDLGDYDGCSVAVHRFSTAGEVKGDDPDKEEHPGPSDSGLGMGQMTSLINISVEELLKKEEAEVHYRLIEEEEEEEDEGGGEGIGGRGGGRGRGGRGGGGRGGGGREGGGRGTG